MESFDELDNLKSPLKVEKSLPKWFKRLVVAFIVSLVLIVATKPQYVIKTQYQVKNNACQTKMLWSKVLVGSVITAIPMFIIVSKFY